MGRDDLDTSLLLVHLYDQLRMDEDWSAQEQMRRVVAELLEEAMTGGAGFRVIDRLGQLVGAFEVRRSAPLAGRLRTWLWGYIEIGLPRLGEAPIELTGDDLIRTRQIVDLCLAVTPALPTNWPEHYAGKIRSFFDGAISILNDRRDQILDQATFHLFTLLYRGLLKLSPEYAGLSTQPYVGWLTTHANGMPRGSSWSCVGSTASYRRRSDSELNDLFRSGLEYLDHLERDLYPPESTATYSDLDVADKPEATAKHRIRYDSGSEKLSLPESTPPSLGLKIADEPEDSA